MVVLLFYLNFKIIFLCFLIRGRIKWYKTNTVNSTATYVLMSLDFNPTAAAMAWNRCVSQQLQRGFPRHEHVGNLKLILFPQGKLVPSVAHLCSPLGCVLGFTKAVHTMGTVWLSSGLVTCFKVVWVWLSLFWVVCFGVLFLPFYFHLCKDAKAPWNPWSRW